MFRLERISRATHPEEFNKLDKMDECRNRGHGKWVTHPNGIIECVDCGEVLFCRAVPYDELEYVNWQDPEPKVQ